MPQTALVLGSGLGALAEQVKDAVRIPYGELEGFPAGGVSGHAGEVVAGHIGQTQIVLLSGRVHYYEHGDAAAMRLPIECLADIGIRQLILTNSAGSLREDMPPGSVMLITDHINWSGMNPLIGESSDRRFVGMTNAYHAGMMKSARRVAKAEGIALHEGAYMWFSGPSFETPAEIRMARKLGGDAVGMSTVPEVILARFAGLDVAAFSVITNFGAGMTGNELSHDETKEMAPKGGERLGRLIAAMLQEQHP
ncbi:purine-nucleoside phosphorylase [Salaquimonas pukyongi]|uniref:purine-nucleoside phosphorylase n=1 Tax=Salaquimonas pukyongi TaxID=2712698 RepID=UPI001FCDE5B6|nr:purine-nucleoside phosphorylase [Salaquimonas pukyongi]